MSEPIRVWRFYDAPEWLRKLSYHGGDEDWAAIIPAGMDVPMWMEDGTTFGCCDVQVIEREDGTTITIGAHA